MRRLVAIATVLGAVLLAVLLTGADEGAKGKQYEIVFDNAFGLVTGGDLKVGGVKAGQIKDFRLTDTEPRKVAVKVQVSEPGFDSFRKDAECAVRNQSLIGEYFVDCQLGTSKVRLADGGIVPVEHTSSTIPPDLISNVMRRPYRERFRLILSELGVGLAGRPQELNEVIRRAHPALKEVNETLKILADQNRTIRDFIVDADRVSAAVEPRKREVARWAKEASETAQIQASRAASIKAQWNKLPRFLAEAQPTLAQLEQTADEQIPFLRRMQGAAPHLRRFLNELGPFSEASRRSIRVLGRTTVIGRAALEESREEVAELRRLAFNAPRLGKPLRQFLQTIDDRSRSTENDPSAAAVAPPAPDKTAYKPGQAFTGMENIWNYVFWQVLATNGFDEVSHFLRILALVDDDCSPYRANPDQAQIDRCKSWTGPYQPCVTRPLNVNGTNYCSNQAVDADNPTERKRATPAGADRRGPGEPEAPPLPGKPDLSKPRITLPPAVKDLIDRLPKLPADPDDLPKLPGGAENAVPREQLLDYLLGP